MHIILIGLITGHERQANAIEVHEFDFNASHVSRPNTLWQFYSFPANQNYNSTFKAATLSFNDWNFEIYASICIYMYKYICARIHIYVYMYIYIFFPNQRNDISQTGQFTENHR